MHNWGLNTSAIFYPPEIIGPPSATCSYSSSCHILINPGTTVDISHNIAATVIDKLLDPAIYTCNTLGLDGSCDNQNNCSLLNSWVAMYGPVVTGIILEGHN